MNFIAQRARRVPAFIRLVLLAPALVLPVYWGLTYTGPYRWLAQWQLDNFDGYEVILTGACPMIGLLIPALVVVHLLAGFFPDRANGESQTEDNVTDYIEQHPYQIGFGLAAIGCIAVGAWLLVDSLFIGELTQTTVAALESGEPPASRFVDLTGGHFREREVLGVVEDRREEYYVPLSGKATGPALVYVQLSEFDMEFRADDLKANTRQGVLYHNGLPGLVREDFIRAGTLVADEHWVLEYGESPDGVRGLAVAVASGGCCVGFAVAVFVVIGVVRRRG